MQSKKKKNMNFRRPCCAPGTGDLPIVSRINQVPSLGLSGKVCVSRL